MRGRIISVLIIMFCIASRAEAFITINEIFADPAGDLSGDANHDGIRHGSQDEFIEVLNAGHQIINVSSWSISDNISVRHVFPANSFLQPNSYLVVFAGGSPQLPGINWQLASSGSLGLNNAGDTITLFDRNNQIIDQVIYDSLAGNDEALVRFPEGAGDFVLHSQVQEGLFSPGTGNVTSPRRNTVVPEPATLATFLSGLLAFLRRRKSP